MTIYWSPSLRTVFRGMALALPLLGLWLLAHVGAAPRSMADESAESPNATFHADIHPLVKNHCATCHAGVEPDGGFRLETYAEVRAQIERGVLLERIQDREHPMPPSGLLPLAERRRFQTWADAGYPRGTAPRTSPGSDAPVERPTLAPVDVRRRGFEFLERMQGHWVGHLHLMGQDHPWFAFDYRPIGPAHVHGIFEGGTTGNLFTSFFLADVKGVHTIVARNGGLLNGIYRTSYFVLDTVREENDEQRYRFVDALGGPALMSIEVTFRGDRIHMSAHTSRMGIRTPTLHMRFEGQRRRLQLARKAAKTVGFPTRNVERSFQKGFPEPDWGPGIRVTSASYMWKEAGLDLVALGRRAGDPIRIDQMPHVARLRVDVRRSPAVQGKRLLIYLSTAPLVDRQGKLRIQEGRLADEAGDTILSFPEVAASEDTFEFTYLHPGTYHLTVVGDISGDGFPGPGDVTHKPRRITVAPRSQTSITIDDLTVVN